MVTADKMSKRLLNHYRPGGRGHNVWFMIPCPSCRGGDNDLSVSIGTDGGLIPNSHGRQCSQGGMVGHLKWADIKLERM